MPFIIDGQVTLYFAEANWRDRGKSATGYPPSRRNPAVLRREAPAHRPEQFSFYIFKGRQLAEAGFYTRHT